MMRSSLRRTAFATLVVACGRDAGRAAPPAARADSAFTAVQTRGAGVMGVDQYTSKHVFEDLEDGGRIVLDRDDAADTAGIATIRAHMRDVATDFRAGNFSKPFQVHAQQVPGTDVMAARRSAIRYDVADRPRGAEVRLQTRDTAAVAAIHRFLAFQRSDHRAAGHEGMDPAEHAMHMAAAATPASCAPPASSAAKKDSVLRLSFANGTTAMLKDEPAGDGQVEYTYRGYLGAISYHLVELLLWGGPSTWFEAYDACTGKKVVLDNAPVISPDSTRLVTIGYGVPRTALVKRVQVLARGARGELTMDWDFELALWAHDKPPLDWGPANPRLTGNASLRFDRVDAAGRVVGAASAERDAGGWRFRVDR